MLSEKIIQKAILDYLATRPVIYFFRAGAGAVQTATGRFFKTGKPGLPDIIVLKDSVFYGLEIKTKTGRQSKAQKQAQSEIEAAGGEYHIIRSLKDVKFIL